MLLFTHDRCMLDRVSTTVLGIHGDGSAQMYADYSQYEDLRPAQSRTARTEREKPPEPQPGTPARKKLSYLEQREWDQIEGRITQAEAETQLLQSQLQDPAVTADAARLHAVYNQLQE